MIIERLKPRPIVWQHDRSKTVGASEIGQCARMTWYRKRGYLPEFEENWGYGARGHNVEDWVYKRMSEAGIRLKWKQRTIVSGHLSCTLDGIAKGNIVVDIKSFDPRKKEVVEHKHRMQITAQTGLADAKAGMLLYVNASNYQDMREVWVERDEHAYRALHVRAEAIMVADTPPAREGVIKGGDECRYCVFQTACIGRPIKGGGDLSDQDVSTIGVERAAIREAEAERDLLDRGIAEAKEHIREILRTANALRAPGLARIARAQRTSLNQAAMMADGIDLNKYREPGRETEAVTLE